MQALKKLLDRIIQRVNINLRELGFDVSPYVTEIIPLKQMVKFYAFFSLHLIIRLISNLHIQILQAAIF